MSFESNLELDLRLELEKLELLFHSDDVEVESNSIDFSPSPQKIKKLPLPTKDGKHSQRSSLSVFELAAAEGEKEELQDKLQILLAKTEEVDGKLLELNKNNAELVSKNNLLIKENDELHQKLIELDFQNSLSAKIKKDNNPDTLHSEIEYRQVEFRLAETRARLARCLQSCEDISLAKDAAIRELEQERIARIHAEKERDAYSAAYEASLNHFEKWSLSKRNK
eukprot:gene6943-9497_t